MTAHFIFALAIVPLGISVFIIYKGWPYVNVRIIEIEENDELFVFNSFRRLLKSADKKMVIYDDGDKTPGSIYENPEIVKMIKEKLVKNKHFVMVCRFNLEHSTLFKREFAESDQVHFYPHKGRGGSTHYKIIDDGKIAYLSLHPEGSIKRKVRIYDFSDTRKQRDDVRKKYIGEYLRNSESLFAASVAH